MIFSNLSALLCCVGFRMKKKSNLQCVLHNIDGNDDFLHENMDFATDYYTKDLADKQPLHYTNQVLSIALLAYLE